MNKKVQKALIYVGKRYVLSSSKIQTRIEVPKWIYFHKDSDSQKKQELLKDLSISNDFIDDDEEKSIMDEIGPYLKRMRYEYDHWDNAIHGFKETEKLEWNAKNSEILKRVREFAFPEGSGQLPHVHILDLAENGYIKPHTDSDRFCGDVIAGLSLLTDSVMRFIKADDITFDVKLQRKSLYIMKGCVRYDFTHEILSNENSYFNGERVEKKRRISVICRSEPR
ncbi:alpha-ketoglutarate-dependent dioxygenase alkB homolog 7, mitochondrial [Cimex lectularius]|uniref:Alpha-ketoglutarate-dependent dioxygenase AlkB-like domain-containing protein n=1 Tax=Cimex lectularius TaxID=79782 RepID=A0A8I6S242_CIMLE|nr:alpha-ketoglutarate-dependent dioxygenase alkB homolog 7, mitochondrial [Cimex lectularius]